MWDVCVGTSLGKIQEGTAEKTLHFNGEGRSRSRKTQELGKRGERGSGETGGTEWSGPALHWLETPSSLGFLFSYSLPAPAYARSSLSSVGLPGKSKKGWGPCVSCLVGEFRSYLQGSSQGHQDVSLCWFHHREHQGHWVCPSPYSNPRYFRALTLGHNLLIDEISRVV